MADERKMDLSMAFLKEPDFLELAPKPDKDRPSYICPACGNGGGPDGTGLSRRVETDKEGRRKYKFHCFVCGKHMDIYDLWALAKGIEDKRIVYKQVLEYYGVPSNVGNIGNTDSEFPVAPLQAHNREPEPKQAQDYSAYFLEASKHIEETDYLLKRGISIATLKKFNVGYDPGRQCVIIPTSSHSYETRNTRPDIAKDERYRKAGNVHVFNLDAVYTATQPVFVTEGSIDALSIIEAGGEAISIGSTSDVNALLASLKTHKPNQPLLLALDNDEAGITTQAKLSELLWSNDIECYTPELFDGIFSQCKDANAALQADRAAFTDKVKSLSYEYSKVGRYRRHESDLNTVYSFKASILKKQYDFIPTGFVDLDRLLDGGLYSGLYIIGAITALGKTTFCLQLVNQIAQSGRDVLIFSLEIGADELRAKTISRLTYQQCLERGDTYNARTTRGILTGAFYAGYSKDIEATIDNAIDFYGTYAEHIYILEGIGDIGIKEIREHVARHTKITGQAPVVLVDYLQIIAPKDIRATDKQNTDNAVLELKRLSRDFRTPVIGISSFNRNNYTAPVNLSSFKESGAIEYSSDVLIGLQYAGMDFDPKKDKNEPDRQRRVKELMEENEKSGKEGKSQDIQVKVLKNRNGSRGAAFLNFYPMFNYFTGNKPKDKNFTIIA